MAGWNAANGISCVQPPMWGLSPLIPPLLYQIPFKVHLQSSTDFPDSYELEITPIAAG